MLHYVALCCVVLCCVVLCCVVLCCVVLCCVVLCCVVLCCVVLCCVVLCCVALYCIVFFSFQSLAVSNPDPKVLYPLDSWYGTQEIDNKQPQGTPVGVSLAPGPDGMDGSSYQFHRHVNSYIELPNNGGLDVQHSITLLCWLYPENTPGPIIDYSSSTYDRGVVMFITTTRTLYIRYAQRDYSKTSPLITSQSLALNQWHYVGTSYDNTTGIASIWLNGERVVQQNIGANMTLATQDNVRMGVRVNDNRYLSGRITALQVYDAALTASQINKMSDAGLGKKLGHFIESSSLAIKLLAKNK